MGIEIRIAASGAVHVETSRSYTECGEEAEKRSFSVDARVELFEHIEMALASALERRKAEVADIDVVIEGREDAEPDVDLRGVPELKESKPLGPTPETVKVDLPPVFPKTPPAPEKGQF